MTEEEGCDRYGPREADGPYKLGALVRIDGGLNQGYCGQVMGYSGNGRWICVFCRWEEDEESVDIVTGKISRYKEEQLWALTSDVGLYNPR
jgi:hypothetical protein